MKKRSKIAFLDRDGVINSSKINRGYIGKIRDFKWLKGSKTAIRYLRSLKYKVVIVTNQSGIARGYFSLKDLYRINRHFNNELKKIGTKVDKIFFCPYHKDGIIKKYKKKSFLRKPEIGMFLKASKVWNIDKEKSFMIGDQESDMKFAKKAGIKGFFYNEDNLYKFIKKRIN